jgi:hypothetical protein
MEGSEKIFSIRPVKEDQYGPANKRSFCLASIPFLFLYCESHYSPRANSQACVGQDLSGCWKNVRELGFIMLQWILANAECVIA